jgi:hypothetical protein
MTATLKMAMIRPAEEFGPVLTGRSLAETLRARIETLAAAEPVVVDFDGVEAVSPSFADEIFAKLPVDLVRSGRVRFENVDDDLSVLVAYVTAARGTSV